MIKRSIAVLLGIVIFLGCAGKTNGQSEVPVDPDTPSMSETEPAEETTVEEPGEEPRFQELVKGDFTLSWLAEGDYLLVSLSAPTTGWVSLGIAPSTMMKDADFIIGYVEDGKVHIRDEFGDGNTSHKQDTELGGTDNITDKSGWEKDGVTQISFKIPLNSGDSYDKVLEPGGKYKVIFAYGPKDDFTSYHKKKASAEIKSL